MPWAQVLLCASSDGQPEGIVVGSCRVIEVTFEAEQIPHLKVEQQQLVVIKALLFEKRAQLSAACAEADSERSGVLSPAQLATTAAEVLSVPISSSLIHKLLRGATGPVSYEAFMNRSPPPFPYEAFMNRALPPAPPSYPSPSTRLLFVSLAGFTSHQLTWSRSIR